MIYIETNSISAYRNFAIEYYFSSVKKLDDTVFLIWQTTPTLMVGKFQNILEEVDYRYANEKGINIVRRMSGGGTIYTDLGGFQFSFIKYNDDENINFDKFIIPVVKFLNDLGIPVIFSGRNDLLVDNKKISGNAQYKVKGTTVHHGSLLFNTNIDEMVNSTRVDQEKFKSKAIKSVRERVTNISEHLKENISLKEFKEKLIDSLMPDSIYEISKEDEKAIEEIEKTYFRNIDYLDNKNPDFIMKKKKKLKGGLLKINLSVKKGIIDNVEIFGDFFANDNFYLLSKDIIGAKLEREDLEKRLNKEYIYSISSKDIIDTIME